ncbi:hypothetical protein WJX72_011076 [[Myrmecia] bisecta]|uniref:Uncharacterized protein n=1 Tax=[Myrmecia] bisecta TaxID=41462 RepID=A0AAW1QTV8_9CHLO
MADAAVPRGKQREEALPGRSGAATLPTIAEGAASGESSEDEEGSGAAASFDQGTAVGCVLTLMLGLEASGSAYTAGMDPGRKLKDMLDLVFSPQAGSGPGTELEPESELWLDPLRWAEQFAAVSYGDPLFGAVLALLLRPDMPSAVQGTVLQVLADQRVLHALPSLADAPGGPPAFLAGPPPRDIIELRIAFAESCCGGDTALLAKLHHASH